MAISKTLQKALDKVRYDTKGRNKEKNIVLRRGFFYTHGMTAETFALSVEKAIAEAGSKARVVDSGEVWKDFRGGASIANQSHWWVEIKDEIPNQ